MHVIMGRSKGEDDELDLEDLFDLPDLPESFDLMDRVELVGETTSRVRLCSDPNARDGIGGVDALLVNEAGSGRLWKGRMGDVVVDRDCWNRPKALVPPLV